MSLYSNFRIGIAQRKTPEGDFNGAVFGEYWAGNRLFYLSAPRKAGQFIKFNRPDLTLERKPSEKVWRVHKRRDNKMFLILSSRPDERNRSGASGTIIAPIGQSVKLLDCARTHYATGGSWDVALLQAQPGDIFATRISACGRPRYHFYLVASNREVVEATTDHFAEAYRKVMKSLDRKYADAETFLSERSWCDVWGELASYKIEP